MPPRRGPVVQALALVLILAACYAVAAGGAAYTVNSLKDWYPALRKPSFNPPDNVFGPVWGILYTAMAVAAWMVWRADSFEKTKGALGVFGVQLLLNFGWSLVFFGLQRPDLAFAEILLLWFAIVATIIVFWRIKPASGVILLPYLGWVTFAAVLNFAIWRLNA